MTYKAVGISIISYAAPVFSTNLRDTNYRNIHYTQNEDLKIATGCHKMSSVDHLHVGADMLRVREHSITTWETPKRLMKETLFTRHRNTVEPMMLADNKKATLQTIHTGAVNKAIKDQEK